MSLDQPTTHGVSPRPDPVSMQGTLRRLFAGWRCLEHAMESIAVSATSGAGLMDQPIKEPRNFRSDLRLIACRSQCSSVTASRSSSRRMPSPSQAVANEGSTETIRRRRLAPLRIVATAEVRRGN